MEKVFTKEWFYAAFIRAIKTFFQTFIAVIGTASLLSSVNWLEVLSASAMAFILSIATSITGLPEVKVNNQSNNNEDLND